MEATETSSMAREVLAYLSEHPNAQDTLTGILQWWLLERRIQQWTATVQAALDELVEEGMILKRQDRVGEMIYQVNHHKLSAIRARLKDESK